jgi:TatD DNase family protein
MIDTHAHIDDPQYAEHFDDFIAAQKAAGVTAILVPGTELDSLTAVPKVCERYPDYLFPAIGLHPENVGADYKDVLDRMEAALDKHPWIAIGEIGLDYHFDTTYKSEQQDAFRRQLRWAVERNLPVMIHSRDATEDCLDILRETNVRGVMHCYSGSYETARQIIDLGLYLGIGGVLTFKNCKLRETLARIPLSSLVLETDAPYMAPVPHRGQLNESRFMVHVVDMLADIYCTTPAGIDAVTTANAKALFGIK